MKKIFRLFAALAATTMAFSCMEEANPETGVQNGGSKYEGPMTTITFSLGELETKTAWDGENHTWSEGDQIKIIWMDAEGQIGDAPADVVNGAVTATVGVADTYYAVYPETTEYALTIPEGQTEPQFSVTIPKVQNGSFKQANVMAAKTTVSEKNLAFKNLTHILKFTLSEGCEYKLFRFYSNSSGDDIRPGASPSLITFLDDDVTVGVPVTNGKQSGYVVARGLSGVGPHYIGVRAGTDYEGGFGYLASKENTESTLTAGTLTTATLNAERGKISYLGILDSYLFDDFYITKTGKGSGKSWSDPAGIDLLQNLLKLKKQDGTAYEGGNGTTKYYRFNDMKIHVAAGEYALASGNDALTLAELTKANITIIGGYPENPVEGSLPTVGPDGSSTIFTTDGTGGTSTRILVIGKPFGNLTFKNIFFKKEGATAAGALLRVNSTASGNLYYENCQFSAQGGNGTNDGLLRIEATPGDGKELNVNFTLCSFVDNNGLDNATMKSGVFYVKSKCKLNINRCEFKNNKANHVADIKADGGAARVFINRTLFQGGHASVQSASWYGSSITTSSADTLCINNCIFDSYTNPGAGTSSSRHLPVIFSQGYHYLINSSVYGSSSQNVRVVLAKKECTNFNNVIVNTKDGGFSIVQSNSVGIFSNYNLLSALNTGGNYIEYQEFDTGIAASDIEFEWVENDFTWKLLDGVTLNANMTKADLQTKTQTNYPAFDAWLKTVEEDPYGIDFNGNVRNPEKLNPGAWDPGL